MTLIYLEEADPTGRELEFYDLAIRLLARAYGRMDTIYRDTRRLLREKNEYIETK